MKARLALVTGATSGIGSALCELLAAQGVNLIATGRNSERLDLLKERVGSRIDFTGIIADLSIKKDRERLIEIIYDRCPDLVINNAGFGTYGDALTFSTEEQESILEVNGKAVLELTLESARALVSNDRQGVILNVSSAAAFLIFPSLAVYSATKAFVNHFSQSLDYEFRPHGIRVLVSCPGMVDTHFQTTAGADEFHDKKIKALTSGEAAELILKQIEDQNPLAIINWKYRFLIALTKILPQSWLASLLSKDVQARINPRKIIKITK